MHLQTMSSPHASSVRVEPVSDPSELRILASVFDIAITASGNKFNEVLMRYVEDPFKEMMKHPEAALSAKVDERSLEQHFLFKAVMTVPNYSARDCKGPGVGNAGGLLTATPMEEKIVGMAIGISIYPRLTHSNSKQWHLWLLQRQMNHQQKLRHLRSQLPRAPNQWLVRSLNQIHSPLIFM